METLADILWMAAFVGAAFVVALVLWWLFADEPWDLD